MRGGPLTFQGVGELVTSLPSDGRDRWFESSHPDFCFCSSTVELRLAMAVIWVRFPAGTSARYERGEEPHHSTLVLLFWQHERFIGR